MGFIQQVAGILSSRREWATVVTWLDKVFPQVQPQTTYNFESRSLTIGWLIWFFITNTGDSRLIRVWFDDFVSVEHLYLQYYVQSQTMWAYTYCQNVYAPPSNAVCGTYCTYTDWYVFGQILFHPHIHTNTLIRPICMYVRMFCADILSPSTNGFCSLKLLRVSFFMPHDVECFSWFSLCEKSIRI